MKKSIILFIISILLAQALASQEYIPLAVEGVHWVIQYDKNETIQPAHDFIYVSHENEDIHSISIFNNIGQEIFRKSENQHKIDVSKLNPGLYIIVLSINKTRIQKKIIIE